MAKDTAKGGGSQSGKGGNSRHSDRKANSYRRSLRYRLDTADKAEHKEKDPARKAAIVVKRRKLERLVAGNKAKAG